LHNKRENQGPERKIRKEKPKKGRFWPFDRRPLRKNAEKPSGKLTDTSIKLKIPITNHGGKRKNNHGRTRIDTDELTNNSEISPVCLFERFAKRGPGILPKKGCAETANPAPPSVLSVRVCG
jgi:hypothetical protein